jgi:hypothetical protein
MKSGPFNVFTIIRYLPCLFSKIKCGKSVFYFGVIDQNNILAICIDMPSRWIEHVKEFAKKNNMSYGCALSDPNLKKGYVPAGDKKRKPEKLEMATPSTEPKPKNIVIKPRPKADVEAIKDFAKAWKESQPKEHPLSNNKKENKVKEKKISPQLADDIATEIMGLTGELMKVERNGSPSERKDLIDKLKKIEDMIESSLKEKKIMKKEYNALKGKKMLGFFYKQLGI